MDLNATPASGWKALCGEGTAKSMFAGNDSRRINSREFLAVNKTGYTHPDSRRPDPAS